MLNRQAVPHELAVTVGHKHRCLVLIDYIGTVGKPIRNYKPFTLVRNA